jgi:hypothetical protein
VRLAGPALANKNGRRNMKPVEEDDYQAEHRRCKSCGELEPNCICEDDEDEKV